MTTQPDHERVLAGARLLDDAIARLVLAVIGVDKLNSPGRADRSGNLLPRSRPCSLDRSSRGAEAE